MKKIIIDTNVLISMSEFKIDLFEGIKDACDFSYQIYIIEGTLKELEKIYQGSKKSKHRQAAKLALMILEVKLKSKELLLMEDPEQVYVDDNLITLSKQGCIILTQDQELKRRLYGPHLIIRQKKYVKLIE